MTVWVGLLYKVQFLSNTVDRIWCRNQVACFEGCSDLKTAHTRYERQYHSKTQISVPGALPSLSQMNRPLCPALLDELLLILVTAHLAWFEVLRTLSQKGKAASGLIGKYSQSPWWARVGWDVSTTRFCVPFTCSEHIPIKLLKIRQVEKKKDDLSASIEIIFYRQART